MRRAIISFVMSIRLSAWYNSAPTGWIFVKYDIWVLFFENLSRKLKFHYNLTTITGTLHEYRYTFLIISRSVLLRLRNVSDKSCRGTQNTHFMLSKFFIFSRWTLLHCVSQTAYVYWKKWVFLNISHNTTYFVYFIKLTTCFGLYLRPSSGHKLHVILFWGNFTV